MNHLGVRLSTGDGSQRRRLLMSTDTVGGVWTYSLDLAQALVKEGVDVLLAAVGPSFSDAQRALAGATEGVRIEYLEARLEWMQEPWSDVENTRQWLVALEREYRPDWIQLNQYCYTPADFHAPTLLVGHSCVYSWFSAVKRCCPGEEWERYRRAVREGLAAASGVTAISEGMLDDLERWYGDFRRLPAIRNGRDIAGIDDGIKKPHILSAGRVWDEAKNIALLDSIAPRLPWRIKVAGDSEMSEGNAYQRIDNLELLGQVDSHAMRQEFQAASIYAAPARYEPFGLAILEAAAAGCALALADIPSLRANWEGAALFLDPRNPEAWYNGLSQLIQDEPVRQHFGELAQQRARSGEFGTKRMARGYLQAYDNITPLSHLEGSNKIA